MRRALLALLLLSGWSSTAAPSVSGSPRYIAQPQGPLLVGQGGQVGLWARAEEEGLLRLWAVDAMVPPGPGAMVELVVVLLKEGAQVPPAGRELRFEPSGWLEMVAVEGGTVKAQVRAVHADAFSFELEVSPGAADEVRIGMDGAWAQPGRALVLGGDGAADPGGGLFHRLAQVPASGRMRFVLGVGPSAAAAEQAAGRADNLKEGYLARRARFPGPHDSTEEGRALYEAALSQLLANEASAGTSPGGMMAHKGARSLYAPWDSAFQAWALAEADPSAALGALWVHLEGRVADLAHPDFGMRHGRLDAARAPGPVHFSQLAPFGLPLRAIQDRKGGPSAEQLAPLVAAGLDAFDWWARRRDRDQDLRYELDGAIEHPHSDSPRFTAFWSPQENLLPVGEGGTRPALNAVDLNAWLAHEAVELARAAGSFDPATAERARLRAAPLAARLLDPAEGHLGQSDGAYWDYVRRGDERQRDFGPKVASPANWSPLSAGLLRDPERIRDVVRRHLLDPGRILEGGTPADALLALLALYRYGWEAEAELLRARLLALLASSPNLHAAYSKEGLGLGPGGDGVTAAVAILVLRDRHQEEAFAVQEGLAASSRQGYFRRLFRMGDGRVALQVGVEGSDELPRTRLQAQSQLFSHEPMTVRLDDPHGQVGEQVVHLSFPLFAEVEVVHRSGEAQTRSRVRGDDERGLALEARIGDELELTVVRFAGERGGCGCASAGPGAVGAWVFLVGALARRRRR